jgi:hypothetical protein
METFNVTNIIKIIDEYLNNFQTSEKLNVILSGLCSIAIIFYFGKIAVTNLTRGGEGFSFDSLRAPVFYVIMLAAWPSLQQFIIDASNAIAYSVSEKQQTALNLNEKNFKKIDENLEDIEKQFRKKQALEAANAEEEGYFGPLLYEMSSIDDQVVMNIYKGSYNFFGYFDSFLYVIFYFVAKLWLKITLIGGGIALTVSIYTGGWTTLINWAKTVVSVTLWVPVSGLIMNLINSILIKVIQDLSVPLTHRVPDEYLEAMAITDFYSGVLRAVLNCLIVTIVFIGLKIIILAKVPSIISGWISGGNSIGSGFAAAFLPVAMAKTATKAGAGAATGTATTDSFKK